MKVLVVVPDLSPSTGGPVATVLGLAESLASTTQRVSIAATDFGIEAPPEVDGVDVRLFRCRLRSRRWSPGLWEFLKSEVSRYDLVSIHTLWQYPTCAAGMACRRAQVPYVVAPQGMLDRWSVSQKAWRKTLYLLAVEGRTLRRAAALHASSEGERIKSGLERWNRSVSVIPWGVSRAAYTDLPDRSRFADRFPALRDKQFVLFLGRLHPKKQPDVALRAFHKVCAKEKNTFLVLAGPGQAEYVSTLRKSACDLGIEDRVVFTGLLRGRAVQEAYRAASLFVLPSWQENFGNAVVEAMAAGCPVVVSDRIDLAPDIERANAGVVAPPSVDATAEAVARLLGDEALRVSLGHNGRRLVLERFTWEGVAPKVLAAYQDVVSGCRRSPEWRECQ
ncbi:MAG TPA: glycosyltransferase [Candidatus Methylomirabilis sp.]|nr:glycosyltransferase [Candidatus Methylomirabilis sp.]